MQHNKFTNCSQDESKVLSDLESRNDIIITQKRWSNLYNWREILYKRIWKAVTYIQNYILLHATLHTSTKWSIKNKSKQKICSKYNNWNQQIRKKAFSIQPKIYKEGIPGRSVKSWHENWHEIIQDK